MSETDFKQDNEKQNKNSISQSQSICRSSSKFQLIIKHSPFKKKTYICLYKNI